MATAIVPSRSCIYGTCADLVAHLGGIPIARIRLRPKPPGQATEQDVTDVHEKEGRICELIDGVLVEKPMGSYESRLASVLIFFLELYLDTKDLGVVLGEAGFLRLSPGQVRAPDVSFIAWKHMPNQEFPSDKIAALVPDLAVEILSESNTDAEIQRKLSDYFEAGTRLAWVADPRERIVRVHTRPHKFVTLTERDTLDGKRVLPGFSLPIKKWFQRASRKPRK